MLHGLAITHRCRPSRLVMVALAVVAILASAPHAFAKDSHARPKEIAIQITEAGFVPASVRIDLACGMGMYRGVVVVR